MTSIQLSFTVQSTDPEQSLNFQAFVDDQIIFDSAVGDPVVVSHLIGDDIDSDHCLKFLLKDKTSAHTTIDENGKIISDVRLKISEIAFDGIELKEIVHTQSQYTHNFNGNGEQTQVAFFGEMGCNGIVELPFKTPVYLWLLEHM